MAFADRVLAPAPREGGLPCSVGTLLAALDDAERSAFEQMLASSSWSEGMIYDAVQGEGHRVARQSINRHRRGDCRCGE